MQVYGLLSRIFLGPPDEIMLKTLNESVIPALKKDADNPELPETMKQGINNLIKYFSEIDTDNAQSLIQMGNDFTFLLRGIRKNYSPLPPYESLYSPEKTLYGETTQKVKHDYAEMGVEIDGIYSGEPPDHLGLELEFMRHLCGMEMEYLKLNDNDR